MSESKRIRQLIPADGWFYEARPKPDPMAEGYEWSHQRIVAWALVDITEENDEWEAVLGVVRDYGLTGEFVDPTECVHWTEVRCPVVLDGDDEGGPDWNCKHYQSLPKVVTPSKPPIHLEELPPTPSGLTH